MKEPLSLKLKDQTMFEHNIRAIIFAERDEPNDGLLFVENDEGSDGYHDIVLMKRADILDGSWHGIHESIFNAWISNGYPDDEAHYHFGGENGETTKEQFMVLIAGHSTRFPQCRNKAPAVILISGNISWRPISNP